MFVTESLRDDLFRISERCQREGIEFAGHVQWNGFDFSIPTCYTDNRRGDVVVPPECLHDRHVVYHTHPSPASGLFSLPSARDFQVFVEAYPHIQTHFILERHGFIRVTFDWTPYNKPDPNEMFTRLTQFLSDHGVNERIVDIDGFAFYKSSVDEWRYVINDHVSSFTHHCFGLRLCFISWDEPLEASHFYLKSTSDMMIP